MPQAAMSAASSMTLAACNSAFEGMQPTFKHTPPSTGQRSISVTLRPRSAARNAASDADCPGDPQETTAEEDDAFDTDPFAGSVSESASGNLIRFVEDLWRRAVIADGDPFAFPARFAEQDPAQRSGEYATFQGAISAHKKEFDKD